MLPSEAGGGFRAPRQPKLPPPREPKGWTRRRVLYGAAGAAAFAALPVRGSARSPVAVKLDFGPFAMGIQSFTLRQLELGAMLDAVASLGLCCVEAIPETKVWFYEFGNHVPVVEDPVAIARMQEQVATRGLRLSASGVHSIPDAAAAAGLFAFARAMQIPVLTVDPAPEALDACDGLCAEHAEVRLAIHNHGPWLRYETIEEVERALDGRHPGFGACIDTGHFIRSGEDPVTAVQRLGPRVHAVHLKDFAGPGLMPESRVLGQGRLDLDGFFAALLAAGFGPDDALSLEYEESPDDLLVVIQQNLRAASASIQRVVAGRSARLSP